MRLGFAALLKFLLWRGRFPHAAHELPDAAVAHLARATPLGKRLALRTLQNHDNLSLEALPEA